MKVICVNNQSILERLSVTVGKWYDANDCGMSPDLILVKNDSDTWCYLDRKNFRTLEEIREDKLKEIGL